MRTKSNTIQSLETITDHGGHLVLVERGSKRPIPRYPWRRFKPSVEIALAHDGRLGLIPWSIHCTALDVDRGDAGLLWPPRAQYPTQRKDGRHLYYDDDKPRGNGKWTGPGGCAGDIRGANGYLVLHNDGVHRLAHGLLKGHQGRLFPFPEELIERAEAQLIVPAEPTPNEIRLCAVPSLDLETVFPGARHESHFHVVRLWAYKQHRGHDLAEWKGRVRQFSLQSRQRLPEPFPKQDAVATAYSVSTWVWDHFSRDYKHFRPGAPLDHSSTAQSYRGKRSGVSRRAAVKGRDKAVLKAHRAGHSMRKVAAGFGLSLNAVWKIVRRSSVRRTS